MAKNDKELIADQNRDIKQTIDDLQTDIFEVIGKEFKRMPTNPNAAKTWIRANMPRIKKKAQRVVEKASPATRRLIDSQIKNVANATVTNVDKDLKSNEQQPRHTKKEATAPDIKENQIIMDGVVDTVMGNITKDVNRFLGIETTNKLMADIDKGKEPMSAVDQIMGKFSTDGFGKTSENGISRTPSSMLNSELNKEVLDMHTSISAERIVQHGEGLVKISSHNDASMLCSPFNGKVLAINAQILNRERALGNPLLKDDIKAVDRHGVIHRVKPTVDEAGKWVPTKTGNGIGLFTNPYCRHTMTPYKAGDSLEKPPSESENEKIRKQRAKGIELEGKLNLWNKKQKAALTPASKKTADDKLRLYRSQAKQFTAKTGMPVRGLKQQKPKPMSTKDMEKTIGENNE